MKVNDKESFGGRNVLAPFVFLAFDPTIATSKLGTERVGDVGDLPATIGRTERKKEKRENVEVSHGLVGWDEFASTDGARRRRASPTCRSRVCPNGGEGREGRHDDIGAGARERFAQGNFR